jgi:DNA helicase II / ATP-dependent DNA helicase PcrA
MAGPSDLATGTMADIEEERHLLYVAMTRAKDNLHLIVPQRFFVHSQQSNGDRHMYASRTRFIQLTFSVIFRDALGQSLQCRQRGKGLQASRSTSARACVECGKDRDI